MDQNDGSSPECPVDKPARPQGGETLALVESGGEAIERDDARLEADRDGVEGKEACSNSVNHRDNGEAEDLLGSVVHSEQEAYNLYRDYGLRLGFSVRKGRQSYFIGTRDIRIKEYTCSKEGFKRYEDQSETTYNRVDTRTGCEAMIQFTVDKSGLWKVTRWVKEHNHEFVNPDERHRLRSAHSDFWKKRSAPSLTPPEPSVFESTVHREVQTPGAYNVGGKAEPSRSHDRARHDNRDVLRSARSAIAAKSSNAESVVNVGTKAVDAYYTMAEAELIYRRRAMHYAYILVSKSQAHEEMREILLDAFDQADAALDKCLSKLSAEARSAARDIEILAGDKVPMSSPPCVSPDGISNAGSRDNFEKHKKKSRGEKSSRKKKQATGTSSEMVVATQVPGNPLFPSPIDLAMNNSFPVPPNFANNPFLLSPHPIAFAPQAGPAPMDPRSNPFPVQPDPMSSSLTVPPDSRSSPFRAPLLNFIQDSQSQGSKLSTSSANDSKPM